jgi:hypothetical protein
MRLGNTSLVPNSPSYNVLIPNGPPPDEARVLCPRTRFGHDLDTNFPKVGIAHPVFDAAAFLLGTISNAARAPVRFATLLLE